MADVGIINRDSIFFTVESPDVSLNEQDLSEHLESFSITERTNAMPQGTLSFNDPGHVISRIFRVGAKLKVSWGYKDFGQTLDSLLPKDLNLDEITGPIIRRGIEGFISSPSGGAAQNGKISFNCNFTGLNFRGPDSNNEFTSGNKRGVINQAFDAIGVSPLYRKIDFSRGSDSVTTQHSVRQDETTFLFLVRLAKEWGALFHMAYMQDGSIGAMFIDPDRTDKNPLPRWLYKSIGNSHLLGWNGSIQNVISYSWTNNQGESGIGDNVILEPVNGELVFRRFQAKDQSVTTWKLNYEKVQALYADNNVSQAERTKFTTEYFNTKSFEEVKHFFDPVESSTAPQGYGYRVKARMIGNPLVAPPSKVKFNNGFPDQIGSADTTWYLETVTHTINNSGYFMDVEIVDAFNLSPVGLVIE